MADRSLREATDDFATQGDDPLADDAARLVDIAERVLAGEPAASLAGGDFVTHGYPPRTTPVPPLAEAFATWVEQHGYVWFEPDLALAAAIATHLEIATLMIDGLAVADDVPGVTQG